MPRRIAIMLLCLAPELAAFAQESVEDEANAASREEREELEPAVPSEVLAAGSERRYTDSGVMDELELGRSEITGNQELPKVLYIVPWRKSDPGDLMGRPVNTLLNEVLAPVDRSEFVRQVDYYHRLNDDNR
ncbi:MAG: hypothetical protein OEW35_07235 [Gammaproteobacteria bacterium]|nr:hypothetical protein [Gammaproteobacteria bacterium]MDH4254689.1 hypothetical protein [Gammaproteobacteria bacterium]MDH5308792.1 hypothetical protein [Gammaproteobacteria bacterium]